MSATWMALSASVRGEMHTRLGKDNQDSVRVHQEGDILFMAVADGHGSSRSFRSARGSALATECAMRALRDLLWRHGEDAPLSTFRRQMERRIPQLIVDDWHRAVRQDLMRDPFSELDFAAFPEKPPRVSPGEDLPFHAYLAYGATLVMTAITPRFIAYAQLGDGDILQIGKDGGVSRPWPSDHAFHSTETLSLCSTDASLDFQVRVDLRRQAPALILLSTDGYANCFADETGFFTVGRDLLAYLRLGGPAFLQEKLGHWLSESSRDGSHDDITVAMAGRLNALRPTARGEDISS